MRPVEQQFLDAAAVIHYPAWRKLFRPGIAKFLLRQWARSRGRAISKQVRLFTGAEMTVVLPEIISEAIYTYGLFDEIVTWMVLQSTPQGCAALDVGAHYGYFSLLLSQLVGPAGRVYSFEPSPSTYAVLVTNAQRVANITPVNCAAGNADGAVKITDFGLQYSAWNTLAAESRMPGVLATVRERRVEAKMVRLDDFVRSQGIEPCFVKIDAENYELEVVKGLEQTILQHHPAILLESGSDAALAAGGRLAKHGYRPWVCPRPGELQPWGGPLVEANARFKDILFRVPTR